MPRTLDGKKAFSITLPESMYGEFFNLFPEPGERTAFLRDVIATAIMLGKREKLSTKIAALMQQRGEEG